MPSACPPSVVAANDHFGEFQYDHYDPGVRRPPDLLPFVTVDRRTRTPLYRQIYEGYREAIVGGRLRPGQRLPSTRGLAAELAISRIPVLGAFEQLLAEGYFESRVGAGTFVARSLPANLFDAGHREAVGGRKTRPGRRALPRNPGVPLRPPEPWLQGWGAFRV